MSSTDIAIVEPHAKALEACADRLEAAGIGCHPSEGHIVKLRKMAGAMRADAAVGKMPHIYREHETFSAAAAGKGAAASQELTPFLKRMMANANIEAPPPGKFLAKADVDAALAKAGIAVNERLALKIALERTGLMV